MRQNSNYPRDVVDALMLAVKETAHDCELDCFVEVFCLTLKTFIKVTVNSIYTGIFGAPRCSPRATCPGKKKKKKKKGSLSLIAPERFFFNGFGPEKTSFDTSKVAAIPIEGS